MNPKIREFADKAKMSTYLLAYGIEFNLAVERFAQLIIEECAKVCEAGITNAQDWDSSYWDEACENRANTIRAMKYE